VVYVEPNKVESVVGCGANTGVLFSIYIVRRNNFNSDYKINNPMENNSFENEFEK
jgi:hypothetical protein